MIDNNNNQEDYQLNFFRRVLKRLIAPWAWNFENERIPTDKFPDLSQLIQIGSNKHWIINGVDTGIIAEGRKGYSAYEIAVAQGFNGTEAEWLESLKGERGDRGLQGVRGPVGLTGETGEPGIRGVKGDTPTIIDNMWYISGINTGVRALGKDGLNGVDGRDGNDGENGQAGISIIDVTEHYLASSQSTGISRTETPGWTVSMQQLTPTKRYLWSYKDITYSNNTHQYTPDIIIGVYGNTGRDAALNTQQEELLQTVSEDLGEMNSKLGELATYNNAGHITGITAYLSTKIEDTIAGFATSTQVPEGGGSSILQTLFAKIDGPNSPMASLIQAVDPTGASISSIAQLGAYIGSISTKVDAQSVETALSAVADINGRITAASLVAAINNGDSIITAHANNFSIINSVGDTTFSIDSNGNLTALGNATFTGNIIARSLTLGTGVTIPQSGVSGLSTALNGKANDGSVIKKDTMLGTLPAIGATSANTSGFMVDSNGLLTASNAVIYGTVYATDGVFSGELTSTSGNIGAWTIDQSGLKSRVDIGSSDFPYIWIDKRLSQTKANYVKLDLSGLCMSDVTISAGGAFEETTNALNMDGSGQLGRNIITWGGASGSHFQSLRNLGNGIQIGDFFDSNGNLDFIGLAIYYDTIQVGTIQAEENLNGNNTGFLITSDIVCFDALVFSNSSIEASSKFIVDGSDGINGSFTTANNKTVTVKGGIITSIQ